jgi:ferric-dicitrate binding protein FerR (iron transport regulator)
MQLLSSGDTASGVSWATRAASATAVIAAIMLFAISARAQTPAGTISSVTGNVEILRAGKTIAASAGTPVQVGDQLKTGPGANVAVMLSDKSRFELGESAQMTIDQHTFGGGNATTHLGLAMGSLRNWVAKLASGNAANYEVHTPNAVAAARGTMYDVQYQDNVNRKQFKGCKEFTDVAVYQDSVDVTNPTAPGNQHVNVKQGQKTTVPCALIPLAPVAIGAAEAGSNTGAAAAAGAAVTSAGVLGGLAGAGAFDNSSSNSNPPASPSQ